MMSISSSLGLTKKMMFLTSAWGRRPGFRVNIFSTSCSCRETKRQLQPLPPFWKPIMIKRKTHLEQRVLRDQPERPGQVLVPHDGLRRDREALSRALPARLPSPPLRPSPWSPRTYRGTRAAPCAPPRAAPSGSRAPSSGEPPSLPPGGGGQLTRHVTAEAVPGPAGAARPHSAPRWAPGETQRDAAGTACNARGTEESKRFFSQNITLIYICIYTHTHAHCIEGERMQKKKKKKKACLKLFQVCTADGFLKPTAAPHPVCTAHPRHCTAARCARGRAGGQGHKLQANE